MRALSDMNAGEKGIVKKVNADGELKQRLFSLGLHKGSHLQIKATSIAKSTMEIEVGTTLLALRFEEAKSIEVSPL
ncbi:FeoA family protein [Sulfurospirillum oryzae]|uniref:FeoA family protein n=1 Tax=Sulfurospirillum oryzae TaxID=2976535 RepID=UPI0021E93F18|nr:FeoA family protein [Sulfurospirillum oryzae]